MTDDLKKLPAVFFRSASGAEPVREWLKVLGQIRPPGYWVWRREGGVCLAGWHAALPRPVWGVMGDTEQPSAWPDRSRYFLRQRGADGSVAWL